MYGVVFAALLSTGSVGQVGSLPTYSGGSISLGCYGGIPIYSGCPVGGVIYPGGLGGGTYPLGSFPFLSPGSPSTGGTPGGTGGTPGGTSPSPEGKEAQELKDLVEDLNKERALRRAEELKRAADLLKQRVLEQQIEEIRRTLDRLKGVGPAPRPGGPPLIPLPPPRTAPELPPPRTGKVLLEVPEGASLEVNGRRQEMRPSFLTPPKLEPGREYHYDFRVTVDRDGAAETRARRVTLRAGEVVRIAFDDMWLVRWPGIPGTEG